MSTKLRPFLALVMATGALPALAQADQQTRVVEADQDEEETIVVVGTRLISGDPSARVEVMDAAEIKARGLSTAEEVIRSIPQNFSTINGFNNLDGGSPVLDSNLGSLALGVSTANLRGFGSANTLVLVNGKRIAAVAGNDDFFANIRHIPASAIERVEVHLDGGSAVFGSEAVAGVINIVLKKDYNGVGVTGRYENSSTAAHAKNLSAFGGFGWETGSASLAVSLSKGDPVSNAKAGWTSRDHSAKYGGDQNYNFVGTGNPRSGRVGLSRWGPFNLMLPVGNDGRNAQRGDFVASGPGDFLDIVPVDAGGETEDTSVTASIQQSVGEKLDLRGEVLMTNAETAARITTFGFNAILVPASNAFNNFGHDVHVQYNADTETELGLLPSVVQMDESWQKRYLVGFDFRFNDKMQFVLDYYSAESGGESDQFMFSPASTRVDDPAVVQRLNDLIASDDPNTALNLFGDGTGQNPTIREFFKSFASANDRSYSEALEWYFTGEVAEVPAGPVSIVVGREERKDWIEEVGSTLLLESRGVAKPTRDFSSTFAEILVPLVSNSDTTGLRDLSLTAQVHYDEYGAEGAVGINDDGTPNVQQVRFDNISPRLGIYWGVADNLIVRISKSEAFRPPVFGELFSTRARSQFSFSVYDPLAPSLFVPAILTIGPNPELSPERSTNLSFSVDWSPAAIDGLRVQAGWSEIDFTDRIAHSSELRQLLPLEVYGNLPQFFVRDENGTLIEGISSSINIARRLNSTFDVNVSYSFATDLGTFEPGIYYYRVLKMFDQAVPGADEFEFLGESVGIDRAGAVGSLHWRYDKLVADLYVNYTPGYINNDFENTFRALPNEDVDPHYTVDLTGSYDLGHGLLLRAGGRNIFDAEFPYMLSSEGRPWDAKRVDPRKRVLFVEANYSFGLN